MRLRIAVAATTLAVVSVLEGQTIDPALTAAIAARDQAGIASDKIAMSKYTADDYASINPSGALMNKKQRVDGLTPAAPGSKPTPPMRTEAVHMYGPAAAVVRMKGATNRQLVLWIKNSSGWQAEAIHVVPDTFMPQQTPQERPKTPEASTYLAPSGLTGEAAAVFDAQKKIQDAFFKGDKAGWDKLTAADHVRLNPGLVRFASEGQGFDGMPRHQPKFSNITVQVWGQVAVVRWLETGTVGQWLTRVLAKTANGWQQVATASSLPGNPPIAP